MIVVIIKTVVLTLCILTVLLMFFARKYDFCIWKKYKNPKVYFSDEKHIYDKFNCCINNNIKRSRIELDFNHNTIRIETKDSPEVLTYTFSKYKVTEDDDGNVNNVEFMFEDGYEIERVSLELGTWRNKLVFRHLEIVTKNCNSVIKYD